MNTIGRPQKYDESYVLEQAMDLFWEKGYESCSTSDLCEKTGLGRGSLYNTYGSKHNLYELSLKRYHSYWINEQERLLNRYSTTLQNLEGFLEWAVEEDFDENSKGCMLINASMERGNYDETVKKYSRKHAELLERLINKIIIEGVNNQEINSKLSVEEISRNYLCSFYGLRALNASIRDLNTAKNTVKSIMANFK
ncbi:TetR/AcrR family transcriptional regulator [Mammaliicoccus sciuri]|uniref:TetR/AcrR family transcriptional regulator n=1 Tax=Mammaliicoccus sciuri TaxID=1296 RepID=A0AAI8DHA1_MAMSC|nr:TetR/AcrR family transcriptional regulator [Mammaliicoccus sciuri]OOV38780.1 hypothetical protein BS756_05055 [Staphylococcus sp. MB371]ASE35082.1 TetR/AcrR family transcriptional regulator [Mammaliicoccus sciuri]MBO3079932.1 TetR/AcrR family transcriptional regulator [Mammaliicoccus sciuri]MCD8860366.1 TetR/AcrR family transcriptional regulator [Mammaliicoccus sciuri]MCY1025961.1 TetR/AcrR family transcriptional regulator [Mammaliicoccus sciuri]